MGQHTPVLSAEIVRLLARPDGVIIDATVGRGGHAAALLEGSGPTSRLLGIDVDPAALAAARQRLAAFGNRVVLVQGTFAELVSIARARGFSKVTGILFDLGLRSDQLTEARGFSFHDQASLDMRFDPTGSIRLSEPALPALQRLARQRASYTAADVIARLSAADLATVFRRFGEERFAERIARAIVTERRRHRITTAAELNSLVVRSLPAGARHGRLHAATRVFQALRMAVNRETESLEAGLRHALGLLAPGGRLAVIAYHSGEDRIVKHAFREDARGGAFTLVTRRPLTPSPEERTGNPRSRSAKLRVLESHSTHQ